MPPRRCAALLSMLLLHMVPRYASALQSDPPPVSAPINPVGVRLVAERGSVGAGEAILVGVVLDIPEGWHVYGKDIPDGTAGLPTEVAWTLPEGFAEVETIYPEQTRFESEGGSGLGYSGRAVIVTRIRAPANLETGAPIDLSVRVSYLACEKLCIPGKATLEARLAAGTDGTPIPAGRTPAETDPSLLRGAAAEEEGPRAARAGMTGTIGLLVAVGLAFLGGILLNLMPCVLPVLSLKISGLLRDAAAEPRLRAVRGLAYGAGVVASFWAIAGTLLILRAGGSAVGWGFQFQDPRTVAAAAVVFFLAALNLFGVFEVGTAIAAAAGNAGSAQDRGGRRAVMGGIGGAFLSGFLATAAATPCTAPFMGAALGWALSQNAAAALSVFTALGIGMALPLALLSIRPALARKLPAPGRWMESLRQAMGFPMAGTALWMAYLLGRLAGIGPVVALLAVLLSVAAGAWIWGRWGTLEATPRSRRAAAFLAIAFIGFPLAALLPAAGKWSVSTSAAAADWEPWSPDRVAELRSQNVPVFVDFGADWCLTCVFNEKTVLNTREIRDRFADTGVVLLKADWTARDDRIARELEANGRAGVPLYLLYPAGGGSPAVLPELLTRGIVADALTALRAASGD